jgi:hypothetical protein
VGLLFVWGPGVAAIPPGYNCRRALPDQGPSSPLDRRHLQSGHDRPAHTDGSPTGVDGLLDRVSRICAVVPRVRQLDETPVLLHVTVLASEALERYCRHVYRLIVPEQAGQPGDDQRRLAGGRLVLSSLQNETIYHRCRFLIKQLVVALKAIEHRIHLTGVCVAP